MKKLRLYNKKTVFTVITVLILTISTVSYTLSLLTEANQQVSQSITNFSRGTYDILIRPPQAHTELEKQLNIVENNYLGIGDGGMTMEDWEKVKKDRKSTRLNSSHVAISYAVFCLKKKNYFSIHLDK